MGLTVISRSCSIGDADCGRGLSIPDQKPASLLGIGFGLKNMGDFVIGEHPRQPVGVEQQCVAAFKVKPVHLDLELGSIAAAGIGDPVAPAELGYFFGRQQTDDRHIRVDFCVFCVSMPAMQSIFPDST